MKKIHLTLYLTVLQILFVAIRISGQCSAPVSQTFKLPCGPGYITLNAVTLSGVGIHRWYTTATGGSPIAGVTQGTSNSSVTTSSYYAYFSANTTLYVSTYYSSTGCESARTPYYVDVDIAKISYTGNIWYVCPGTVTFTASLGDSYQWRLKGTAIPGATSRTYVPLQNGDYTVTVGHSCGWSSTSPSGQVVTNFNPAPTINITADRSTVDCSNPGATLTASGGSSYSWNTGAATASITVSPSSTTSYSVSVQGSNGCTASASKTITVDKTAPVATISTDRGTVTCSNPSATLTASGGSSYSWNTGATTASVTVSPSSSTNYSVTVRGSNGCSASANQTISVDKTVPVAAISTDRSTVTCSSPSATLTASGGSSYSWNTGAATTSITVLPSSSTSYSVSVTGSNGCNASASQTITVDKTAPADPLQANLATQYACSSATLSTSQGLPANTTFYWQTASMGTDKTRSGSYTTSSNGTYYLRSCGTNGCWGPGQASIAVSNLGGTPSAPTITSLSVIGPGQVSFSISAPNGSYTYKWYNSSNTYLSSGTSSTPVSLSENTSLVYKATATNNANNCTSNYGSGTAYAYKKPVITPSSATIATGSPTTLSLNQAYSGISYSSFQWALNGANITGATASTYTACQAGSYSVQVSAPGASGATVSPTVAIADAVKGQTNQNFITSRTILYKGVRTESDVDTLRIEGIQEVVQYFDGLGRPIQTVTTKGSPSRHDIVQPIVYDAFGREEHKYLPYADANASNGTYKSNPLTDQPAFYQTLGFAPGDSTYARTVFEPSPLNRVIEQGAPGADWQPSQGHPVRIAYQTNTATEVKQWSINSSNQCVLRSTNSGFYDANQLYITQTTDENGLVTKEYKDKKGRMVLKSATDGTNILNTYYVYDDLGLLRYVIPPKASAAITVSTLSQNDDVVKKLCYYYQYDPRNRMIIKQLPGADPIYMVYDLRDRLVLSQDGEQRKKNLWLFTKYDIFNRPVMTGLTTNKWHAKTLQDTVNLRTDYKLYESPSTATGNIHNYTNNSFPKVVSADSCLTVTYYDDYTYSGKKNFSTTANISGYNDASGSVNYFDNVKGQVTGTKTKVLDTNIWLSATTYYDDRYRPIQTIRELYDGSNTSGDTISSRYDFSGKIMQVREKQKFSGSSTAIDKVMAYDHAQRLTKITQQILGVDTQPVTLSEITYNELGQVSRKRVGCIQDVDYQYNIRGWISKINDPSSMGSDLFGMQLLYNNVSNAAGLNPTAQYNGNIGAIIVCRRNDASSSTNTTYGYGFTYDRLNRLTDSQYGEGPGFTTSTNKYNEQGISYDLNGNIKTLKRTNGSLIDNLTYTYTNSELSNQLLKIDDGSGNTAGFKDVTGDDFGYDANGNLTKDNNKSIASISYNVLNLPYVLSKDGNNNITYIYDAGGAKLCKTAKVAGVTTNRYYCGIMEYDNTKKLSLIHTDEGLVEVTSGTGTTYNYEYYIKDHLGNTRIVFNSSGNLLQRTDYYPFGLKTDQFTSSTDNKYLYNGKELQQELALDWYDYGRRYYDPQIARWHSVDPAIEDNHYEWTPYAYVYDNPLLYRDLIGCDSTKSNQAFVNPPPLTPLTPLPAPTVTPAPTPSTPPALPAVLNPITILATLYGILMQGDVGDQKQVEHIAEYRVNQYIEKGDLKGLAQYISFYNNKNKNDKIVFRYMTAKEGLFLGKEGMLPNVDRNMNLARKYITPDVYLSRGQAKSNLALPNAPEVAGWTFESKIQATKQPAVGWGRVQPAYNEPGGGNEATINQAFPMMGIFVLPK